MREIVLDTETTGLYPEKGDRIVEIAALEIENRLPTGKYFQCYINPDGREMHPDAERICGISNDFLKDKPLFKDVVFDFLDFIGDSPLVIHNAKFDVKFLNYELNIFGSYNTEILMERCVDTLAIARKKFPGSHVNLDALCKRFAVDNSKRTLHGALIDCELLAEVYLHLMGGPQGVLFAQGDNKQESENVEKSITIQNSSNVTAFPKRTWKIDEKELLAHQEFIKKLLVGSIWE